MTVSRHSKDRPTLSAVVISRNEERNLPGLLANLRSWVDEIVIVDDMSDDDTAQIAAAAGDLVNFVRQPMSRSEGYAGQRNAGIEAATGDWLLHLDCDERVPQDLMEEILAAIRSTTLNGFRYRRQNYFLHRPMRHGGWTSWNRPQLARRGYHRFVGALHEACEIEGGNAAIGQLQCKIAHLNEASFEERLAKSARYVSMNAEELAASGRKVAAREIMISPLVEFSKRYIAQRGFLDGTAGLIGAMHGATSVFRTKALVWDRQNRIDRMLLEQQFAWPHDQRETDASEIAVSIVIPTYNRAHLICDALESVRAQTYQPAEVIVVDDGSDDGTIERIADWRDRTRPTFDLRWEKQDHAGGNAARNRGIREARGTWIAFLDSDDTWLPSKLEKEVAFVSEHPGYGAVYCGLLEVDVETGTVLAEPPHAYASGDLFEALLVRDVTGPTSTYLVRKDLLDEVGGFDTDLEARQDWDLWIRLAERTKIGCVPERLVNLRHHAGPRTATDPTRELRAYRRILDKTLTARRSRGLALRLASRASYHRRAGRVHLHYLGLRGRAIGHYAAALSLWPFELDTWAAFGGAFLPGSLRRPIRTAWNGLFGRGRFAVKSH